MKASVVINVHSGSSLEQFDDAVDSVLRQTYDDLELIVVVSDAPTLRVEIEERYSDTAEMRIVDLEIDDGLSAARNAGAEASVGDVVVFTDDDVVAKADWITELMSIYESHHAAGVGGKAVPLWPDGKPWYLPDEFYWLVGVMHDNFVTEEEPQPVRNTFGCNISFRREVFLDAGGFREDLGKNQTNPLQGEEAELCERIAGEFWYAPAAVVRHKVDSGQLSIRYLIQRAFWQGYSKAALAEDTSNEITFFSDLITDGLPRRLRRPTWQRLGETAMMLSLTGAVGLGFLYGHL